MTVWRVDEKSAEGAQESHFFVCAPCAIIFYNEDRGHRKPPSEASPPDSGLRQDCPH